MLRYSDKFDDPNLPGEMITTVALKPVHCGTEVNITQEGIPAMIPRRCATTAGRNRWCCWASLSRWKYQTSRKAVRLQQIYIAAASFFSSSIASPFNETARSLVAASV